MPARSNRREFQENLAQRLQEAARGERLRSALGVMSGQERWLFDLAEAGAIVPLTPLIGVPLTMHWFVGIAKVRGTLYSVVDFSAFCGSGQSNRGSDARLLLIGGTQGSALLVDRTLGLRRLDGMRLENAQQPPRHPWMGEDFRDEQGQLWHSVRIKQLLAHPDFLSVGLQ